MRGVFICIKSVSLWLGYVGQIINLPRKLEVFDASGPVTSPLPLSRAPVWQGPHHSARSRPRPCSGPGAPASAQPGSPGSLPSPSSVASSLHKALPGLSHDHRAVSVLQAPNACPALPICEAPFPPFPVALGAPVRFGRGPAPAALPHSPAGTCSGHSAPPRLASLLRPVAAGCRPDGVPVRTAFPRRKAGQ